MENEYEKQANDFLARHNMTFSAVLIGSDCPRFCEDAAKMKNMGEVNHFPRKSHIHGKHYRCTISRPCKEAHGGRVEVSFDFWNSYAEEERNFFVAMGRPLEYQYASMPSSVAAIRRKYAKEKGQKYPRAYDMLACIEKNDPGTFEDFCGDFGYDSDSRKAFDVYLAVQDEARKVSRFFTAEEMEELREIN